MKIHPKVEAFSREILPDRIYIYNEGDNESVFFQEYGDTGVNSKTNYQNKNVGIWH
jgi:hypothetical protein